MTEAVGDFQLAEVPPTAAAEDPRRDARLRSACGFRCSLPWRSASSCCSASSSPD